jgi:magnesium transporter
VAHIVCGAITEVLFGLDTAERERVTALRSQQRFFWLDVSRAETSPDDLVELLRIPERAARSLFGSGDAYASRTFHADGDSVAFVLRCYVEPEVPAEEATYRLRPLQVQVLVTADYMLTLHHERVSLPEVLAPDLPEGRTNPYVVYSVLDAMLASTFAALEEIESTLDTLAAASADGGGGLLPRAALREAGSGLAAMRRWVGAEQPVLERVGVEIGALRGFDTDTEPYFDHLDEQVNRLVASIDAAANGMGMLLDLQLNERAYVVSVVATIFVPLTLVTGFFGMNFGWMVDQVDTPIAFWLLGFLVPLAAGLLSWRLLVRRFLSGAAANHAKRMTTGHTCGAEHGRRQQTTPWRSS